MGSAAFNLFFIIAICLLAIPADETRRIKSLGVFLVTAIFSLFAYLWIVIILVGSSPDVIEVWEVHSWGMVWELRCWRLMVGVVAKGAVTLGFFPVLLFLSYKADKGWFDCIDAKVNTADE